MNEGRDYFLFYFPEKFSEVWTHQIWSIPVWLFKEQIKLFSSKEKKLWYRTKKAEIKHKKT